MRLSALLIVMTVSTMVWDSDVVSAQGFGLPGAGGNTAAASSGFPTTASPASPNGQTAVQSLGQASGIATSVAADKTLPSSAGQTYRKYDLKPYTGHLNQVVRPEQAVVDWIIREE